MTNKPKTPIFTPHTLNGILPPMFKIAVICGGPSPERGISLNSARSILDHLSSDSIEIIPFYVDHHLNFYAISPSQLYSNTPSDFDFKLAATATALDYDELSAMLKKVDLVFPAIHGEFGEDGQIQELLEKLQVPFIGSGSKSCRQLYCKYTAQEILKLNGYPTLPSELITKGSDFSRQISQFFKKNHLSRAIIKPTFGGSSIGVSSVRTPEEAMEKCTTLLSQSHIKNCLIEPFCKGTEFTVVVFQSDSGEPVALIPTEIEMNYGENQIFDYRKKYLPTNQAFFHTPPRFNEKILFEIRKQAEELFKLFNARDFIRIDGWVMPDQSIYFTDFNPISGMEQNSFLFRQASLIGLTHHQTLYHIIQSACHRFKISCPPIQKATTTNASLVYVLLGGNSAERQTSLMSGTNVWLKFLRSSQYRPILFFYDPHGEIWNIPYSYALNHTVEEVYHNCLLNTNSGTNLTIKIVQELLNIPSDLKNNIQKMNLNEFLNQASKNQAFVFIALHGGEGEDGTLQSSLEKYQIPFNGSDSIASRLCMNKYLTGNVIRSLDHSQILSLPKTILDIHNSDNDLDRLWKELIQQWGTQQIIVKPMCDGCSAGIVVLHSFNDLIRYVDIARKGLKSIPPFSFINQKEIIEMPSSTDQKFIIEPYIETDKIVIRQKELQHTRKKGWIELTVGVMEKQGNYRVFNPSITIAEGAVLSLEEKFQGGTGINLTPPPESIISKQAVEKIRKLVGIAAAGLGIMNYARIDIFYNYLSEQLVVIEANSLPALTPSTVLYHQALAEEYSLSPLALLEEIISSKMAEIS